jgi:small subunit ribosomal protein S14
VVSHLKKLEQRKEKGNNMARVSNIARDLKRQKMIIQYSAKRKALIAAGDREGLDKLPKNASPTRWKNRCAQTGRPRGYMRKFGVSRIAFREMASSGKIPGIRKASW